MSKWMVFLPFHLPQPAFSLQDSGAMIRPQACLQGGPCLPLWLRSFIPCCSDLWSQVNCDENLVQLCVNFIRLEIIKLFFLNMRESVVARRWKVLWRGLMSWRTAGSSDLIFSFIDEYGNRIVTDTLGRLCRPTGGSAGTPVCIALVFQEAVIT